MTVFKQPMDGSSRGETIREAKARGYEVVEFTDGTQVDIRNACAEEVKNTDVSVPPKGILWIRDNQLEMDFS